jgi:imidazolonepropionase-like amidohydrolase
MNKLPAFCCTLLILILPLSSKSQNKTPSEKLAFIHVTVIDATDSFPKSNMTIVITGNRIIEIGKTGKAHIPQGSQVIDASDKFLIPGLWDMHVHDACDRQWGKNIYLPLYIANGITGIRDMGGPESGNPDTVFKRREEIKEGKLLGPRIIAAGYMLVGPAKGPKEVLIFSNDSESRRAVDFVKQAGADFVKVKELVQRDCYFAIADEARKQGIPLAGHVPTSVDATEVADAGQRSIEHLDGIWFACSTEGKELREEAREEEMKMFRGKASQSDVFRQFITELKKLTETYSKQKADTVFKHLAGLDVWVCPTLAVGLSLAYCGDSSFQNGARLKYIPSVVKRGWDPKLNGRTRNMTTDDYSVLRDNLEKSMKLVKTMKDAGVKLLAGTDTSPNPYAIPDLFPGFSLYDELALYVKAGLTPLEALQTATRNPAEFLGLINELGTIEKGKFADLVLLDSNPLQDITNLNKINAVVLNGRLVDKPALQKMLADAETAATQ